MISEAEKQDFYDLQPRLKAFQDNYKRTNGRNRSFANKADLDANGITSPKVYQGELKVDTYNGSNGTGFRTVARREINMEVHLSEIDVDKRGVTRRDFWTTNFPDGPESRGGR